MEVVMGDLEFKHMILERKTWVNDGSKYDYSEGKDWADVVCYHKSGRRLTGSFGFHYSQGDIERWFNCEENT